jgi:hypothetical protein
MTAGDLFIALLGALVIKDIIIRALDDLSWRLHKKKHGSLIKLLGKAEDVE